MFEPPRKTIPSLSPQASVSGLDRAASAKAAAQEVLDRMPDDVTWEDLMYHLYVREKIEIGLQQLDAGLGTDHDEVFRKLEEDEA